MNAAVRCGWIAYTGLDENYVRTADGMILKDTKAQQIRRVSVDEPMVQLLRKHKATCAEQLLLLDLTISETARLFSTRPDLSKPRDPAQ